VRKGDLALHAARCKEKGPTEDGLAENAKKAWQERSKMLRLTLSKIEAGEIGSLDPRGFFVCSICGEQGLGLLQILSHEEQCRERLSAEGRVPQSNCKDESHALHLVLVDKLAALKTEVAQAAVANEQNPGELLGLSLDRLRDVAKNACFREEKKYRRLRMSNAAVAEAIGRWKAAVEMLQVIGFELVEHTSKTGDSEPHLMMASSLAESTFQVFLDVLDGKAMDSDSSLLEECRFCKRKFRFDRIAKHETRCPESKAKPAKVDVAAKLLAGTPGEKHIPEVRRTLVACTKLPPLIMKKRDEAGEMDMLRECPRCKRRFSSEALEKHAKRCTATPSAAAGPNSGRSSPHPRMRLESLESQSASQTPRAQRPTSSSRQKDASKDATYGRKAGSNDGRCETKETPEIPKNSKTSRASSRQSSRSTRGVAPGDRAEGMERVQRPLTPKRHLETSNESTHKSRSAENAPKTKRNSSRDVGRLMGQPCYEELELDVEAWLDD